MLAWNFAKLGVVGLDRNQLAPPKPPLRAPKRPGNGLDASLSPGQMVEEPYFLAVSA